MMNKNSVLVKRGVAIDRVFDSLKRHTVTNPIDVHSRYSIGVKLKASMLSPRELKVFLRSPVVMMFEDGEVYATNQDVVSNSLFKSFTRKMGVLKSIVPFKGVPAGAYDDPYRINYRYYPTAKRVLRFNRRLAIKKSLPKEYVRFASWARKSNKGVFLNQVTPDFVRVIRTLGYKDAEHFWRVNKYPDKKVPRLKL